MIQELITFLIVVIAVVIAVSKTVKKFSKKKKKKKGNLKSGSCQAEQHYCSDCTAECMLRDAINPTNTQSSKKLCEKVRIKSE